MFIDEIDDVFCNEHLNRNLKGKLTNSFNDVGQNNSVGDIVRQILDASFRLDFFQVMIGPVGVDLSIRREGREMRIIHTN